MKVYNLLKSTLLASAMLSTAASAVNIPLPPGTAILEDDNLEYIMDANGDVKTSGALEVGDSLVAFISFEKVLNGASTTITELGGSNAKELTGISVIEIADITGGVLTFKPSAIFEATYGAGAVAALFSDSPSNFGTDCHLGGIAECLTEATDGDHWLTAGFGDPDDFWFATSTLPGAGFTDIAAVASAAAVTKVGAANYALSILENNTGFGFNEQVSAISPLVTVGGDGFTDIIGSGDVLGGAGLTSPFFARSDFDFQLDRIPEPGSVALFGLGLIAAGALGRRRKAK